MHSADIICVVTNGSLHSSVFVTSGWGIAQSSLLEEEWEEEEGGEEEDEEEEEQEEEEREERTKGRKGQYFTVLLLEQGL